MANTKLGFEVHIDRTKCVGSGNCVLQAPGAFDQDETGYAITTDLTAQPEDIVEFAAETCPMGAISFIRLTET